jgi:NAD(P)-dependent dehydrogenase (short-subunit alcohol dehydrogenase family)
MNKKTCLVTGATSGIGREVALGLAKLGSKVILVCRQADKGRRVLAEIKEVSNSKDVELLVADLSSQTEIRSLANIIYDNYPTLDTVINNAGVVLTEKQYSSDGIEMTLATNHLGPFLLNNLLVDLLKKNAPARIINVSSAIHKWAKLDLEDLQFQRRKYQFMKAYAQSKLLMNITTFELARRLEGTGVTVNCIHPGAVRTNLGSSNTNSLIVQAIDKFIKSFFISPETAAQSLIHLATSSEVKNTTGKYFVKHKIAFPKNVSAEMAKKIWKISENMIISFNY